MQILIADGHAIVRRGIRALIADHSDWEVCAEASDGQEALDLALSKNPDVAVLDFALPVLNGMMVASRLRKVRPDVRILIFATQDDDDTLTAALAAGVRGYVLKSDPDEDLRAALSALVARRTYFSARVGELVMRAAYEKGDGRRSRTARLTAREIEVVQLIADGRSNKQIARDLDVSIKTVETHRASAMRKTGVRSAADFVRYAIKHHLVAA